MKILLTAVNAKYIHSNLAVYSMKAYAREFKDRIEIAEFTINNTKDRILEGIYRAQPDVLCFSCYIWNIEMIRSVAAEFHKLKPEVPIWVGGPEVSYETDLFLRKNPWCKGIMTGEGEATFRELCEYYVNKEKVLNADKNDKTIINYVNPKMPSKEELMSFEAGPEALYRTDLLLAYIDGLAYRFISTPPREPMNMDDIPFPYEDCTGDFSHRIIYYESSRGCPFSCSYCLSSVDKTLRFRSTELVKKELGFFLERNTEQVKFVDRTFNCSHSHAMEIWKYIAEHDNGVTNFHFEISADLLTDDEIELLSGLRPGYVQLEIGVQSVNDATITEIHRTMDLSKLKKAVLAVQKAGNIHEHLDLIAGLPFEDRKSFAVSFDEIYGLKPDQLQLGFLKVLKGSYMYGHAEEYSLIYESTPPYEVLQTEWLGFSDILQIKQVEEMLEVYYNSGQFPVTIRLMELFHKGAYDMFSELGAYYDGNGLFGMSHSRQKRAQILLEYAENRLLCREDFTAHQKEIYRLMLKESLTMDLYLRENCSSRPGWAPDSAEFKEMTHRFCPRGKISHIEPFHFIFPGKNERNPERLPEYTADPVWILFHYDDRDPLDSSARTERIMP